MKKKTIFFIVYLIISVLILDFFVTKLSKNKFNFYKKLYPDLSHRITNQYFHHAFDINVNTFDVWGSYRYKFLTNSLGFKDSSNEVIKLSKQKFKRILIIGDSFTEGIGFEYEDTFVGIIDKKFLKKNIEVFNAGVASQSPIIYLSKINHLIDEINFAFDEVVVFLDISDIVDEVYYKQKNNKLIENNERIEISNRIGDFLLRNFSFILLYENIINRFDQVKRKLEKRFYASKEFNKSFFETTEKEINLYKAINVKRGKWTHDNIYWKKHGEKGRELARSNLYQLLKKCRANDIKFSLAIYPWPSQIYYDIKSDRHRKYWREWSQKNKIKFYDFFKYFEDKDKLKLIDEYFIKGDIHWNKKGHQYIAELFSNEYLD